MTDSILFEQESNVSRVSLLPYSACTGVGVVAGAKKCQAGSTSTSWRGGGGWSWPCVRPVAGSGRPRQSWRTLQPPALCSATLHFPAVLRARNFVLRCRLVQSGGALSYLQCRCALCWEQQFPAVPSAREIFNAASELELENVGALWWRKKTREKRGCYFILGFMGTSAF